LSTSPGPQSAQLETRPSASAALEAPVQDVAADPADVAALCHLPSYLRFFGVAVVGVVLDLWSKHWAFSTLGQVHAPREIIPRVLEFQTMLNPGALFGIGGGQTVLFLIASVCALLLVFWMFSQTSRSRWALQIALGGILAGALGNMYDRVSVRLVDQRVPRGIHAVYTVRTGEDQHGIILKEYPPVDGGAQYRLRSSDNPGGAATVYRYPRGRSLRLEEFPEEVGFVRDFIKIPTRWWGGREIWPWVFNVADMLLVGGVGILAIHLWRDRKRQGRQDRIAVDSPTPTA
jgi:signal peptidase II